MGRTVVAPCHPVGGDIELGKMFGVGRRHRRTTAENQRATRYQGGDDFLLRPALRFLNGGRLHSTGGVLDQLVQRFRRVDRGNFTTRKKNELRTLGQGVEKGAHGKVQPPVDVDL